MLPPASAVSGISRGSAYTLSLIHISVGSVFVLLNDTTSASFQGTILRNARRQDEDYDFGSTPPFPFGKQNGLILQSGNLPSGLSGGDFNGDNVFDIVSSNNLSGTAVSYTHLKTADENLFKSEL